jgi:ribosomal protein S18 acetylase RimI-like enzyme
MPTTVLPLTASHLPHAAMLMARAFQKDPFFTFVLPDPARRARVLPWLYERIIRYGLRYGKVFTTPSIEGINIILGPQHPSLQLAGTLQTGLFLLPTRLTVPEFRRSLRLSNYADWLHRAAITGRHLYILQLGVEPSLQGRGLGGSLFRHALVHADRQALACYLETNNEKNLPLYERNGFTVVGQGQAIPGGPHTWAMLRRPAL